MQVSSSWHTRWTAVQGQQVVTFKTIKLAFGLLSEAQILVTVISQQGQGINIELLLTMY